ncbi:MULTISPECIES: SGNH/GDSL hydrolase family protein [Arenibacter]|uniref:G-D-S-L family lipolytic protein n=1 Tax=Arenibacter TaxID=178469 RepID=UPI000A37D384|nr:MULTISPECIES: G-D-S-L family lipolytic protein [Arenibacter]
MRNIKYVMLSAVLIGFTACNNDDSNEVVIEATPELNVADLNLSNYVAVGASFTAGFSDNALFKASQEKSFPKILSEQFAQGGGGSFTQPLMNDNFGGLAVGGTRITEPRLVFGGAGPVALESLIGPVTVTTDIAINNPSGPFNNLGVPGAKSFHLLAPGYGNLANFPAAANPYFIRMTGTTPNASVLEMAMAQSPTFFSLSEIGGQDVLGYALSGGESNPDASNYSPITPSAVFEASYTALVDGLTANGAKGVVANLPYITSLPHFTTVPHKPLDPSNPDFGPQIPLLNSIFGALNQIYDGLGQPNRKVVFSETAASAVVIRDETLADVSAQLEGALNASPTFPAFIGQFGLPEEAAPMVAQLLGQAYGQTRQATEEDLLVLPSSSVIGTVNTSSVAALMGAGLSQQLAGQFSIEGITLPLADKWVLLPSEQNEIKAATDAYNATIQSVADAKGLALVDFKSILQKASTVGISDGDFILTTALVRGGLVGLDGIHLTSRGYAVMANKFLAAIDAKYGSNFIEAGVKADVGQYPTNYSPTLQ